MQQICNHLGGLDNYCLAPKLVDSVTIWRASD